MLILFGWQCSSGVTPEKLQEGLNPRHCALSLVGEPIMYPEINALVDELHGRRISTFLVTNAQFPEKILMMKPITQVCDVFFVHDLPTLHTLNGTKLCNSLSLISTVICKCRCCHQRELEGH